MTDLALPKTRYVQSGDISIAYQVMGEGPLDIVMVPGVVSNIEAFHELPGYTAFLRRLATFARVITFDKRGQGLSDRMADAPPLEHRTFTDGIGVEDRAATGEALSASFSAASPFLRGMTHAPPL